MAATETKPKQYQSRHRLAWAADFPLKPGRDIMSRRGLLVLIADTAITGQFWQNLKHLESRSGLNKSSLRALLVKLCAEGALRGQARGYKRTTRYTLQRLDEVEQNGGKFLPAEEPQQRFPRTGADRLSTSAYIGAGVEPDQARKNGLERLSTSGRENLTACLPAPKKRVKDKEETGSTSTSNEVLDAPANGASRLPSASTQTPSSFSSTEEDTPPEGRSPEPVSKRFPRTGKQAEVQTNGATAPSVRTNGNHPSKGRHCMDDFDAAYEQYRKRPPISRAAAELNDYLTGGTGRPLPGAWCRYPDLGRQMDRLGFIEVGSVLAELARTRGGFLPEPEEFFGRFGQYRQIHLARQRPRNGRRRAA